MRFYNMHTTQKIVQHKKIQHKVRILGAVLEALYRYRR